MSLIRSFEREGNWLFRKRSYIPLVLFVLVIPFVFTTDYTVIVPIVRMIATWSSIAICVLGFLIRMYAIGTAARGTSGRNTGGQVADALNTTGMYSIVRHPLYLGNYLIWIGIVIYTLNPYFVIIVSLLYWIYYERIMIAEEMHLERTYGEPYLRWAESVPSFIPSPRKFRAAALPVSWKTVISREENGVLAAVIAFLYVDTLMDIRVHGTPAVEPLEIGILSATILAVLVIRILKKKTSLLYDASR
jgi:protein-S-isoprenylcysteine O-methyltransferase Ste14